MMHYANGEMKPSIYFTSQPLSYAVE